MVKSDSKFCKSKSLTHSVPNFVFIQFLILDVKSFKTCPDFRFLSRISIESIRLWIRETGSRIFNTIRRSTATTGLNFIHIFLAVFVIPKCSQLLCTYLQFVFFFGKRKLSKKLFVKCFRNLLQFGTRNLSPEVT